MELRYGQAGLIAGRLAPFHSHMVTSVVPGGLEAYVRVLHPAEDPVAADLVRWAAVAAWNMMPLHRGAQFHSVALSARPAGRPPWSCPGPRQGSLYPPDERGLDAVWGMYRALDRAPLGRNETGHWWRSHDEYDGA